MEAIQFKSEKLINSNIQALNLVFREINSLSEEFLYAKAKIAYDHSSSKNFFTEKLKNLQQKHIEMIEEYKRKAMNISENKSKLKCANSKLELLLGSLRVKENELDSLKSAFKYEANFDAKYEILMKELHDSITLKKKEIEGYKMLTKRTIYKIDRKKAKILNLSEQERGLIVKENYLNVIHNKKSAEFEKLLRNII